MRRLAPQTTSLEWLLFAGLLLSIAVAALTIGAGMLMGR